MGQGIVEGADAGAGAGLGVGSAVTATGGGGDMTVDTITFVAGQVFTITAFTLTAGNA